MPARKAPAWSKAEIAILEREYPRGGLAAACDALSDRSWHAIEQKAHKLGLRSPVMADAPRPMLAGAELEEAIRLREGEGWSFARIGAQLGVCEASAANAVLIALCARRGHTPAERDARGRLTPVGVERLRALLKKGLKAVDIQLRLGLSASRVALERQRYNADLKARGKALLPPPGGGAAYSGVRLGREVKRAVEELLRDGWGTAKVSERTGVSKTSVTRLRARLVKRLARKGETLAGCDAKGRRVTVKGVVAAVPPAAVATLRALLLDGVPVSRAALMVNVGGTTAYRVRDALEAELEADGRTLPVPRRLGRGKGAIERRRIAWLPVGRPNLILYRRLLIECGGDEAEARRRTVRAIAERDGQDPRLAEQFDRLRRGGVVTPKLDLRRPAPTMTLGGVATGAL